MNSVDRTQPVPVAIIGMACMFPKAEDLSRYWSNIRDRVDAITDVPETHWNPADYFDADPAAPDRTYARRGGFLTPVDFPPLDFGIAPNNLEATDTTQLLGLMVARQALDDAGYGSGSTRPLDRDRVSVILGVTGTLELVIPLGARLGHPLWRRAMKAAGIAEATAEEVIKSISDGYVPWQENSFPGLLGNVAAGRIANRLDLGGTNCVVDAACASSLGAVNLAMHELASGRCDMALTGGLDTFNDIFMYMCFSKTPALSPTGDARPFDAAGDGTILGEGLGVLVLKRLEDARRDGDRVYAVIRSVGTSSDGKGNAVYAPSAPGQAKALRDAYSLAAVSPETVELVEAHGTGTKVGDATELTALAEVYREARSEGTWCALGSVKSQIGHTKAAAGAAGLIKAALALHHKVLPPTAKVTLPIAGAAPGVSPLYVNTEPRPWMARDDHPRRAAVSAFGFGGSNFHCVLEEAEATKESIDWDGDVQILAYSAADPETLVGLVGSWPRDLSWDALRGEAARLRSRFQTEAPCRLALVVDRSTDLQKLFDKALALPALKQRQSLASPAEGIYVGFGSPDGSLAMLFPGQGSQYVGMFRELACRFPALQATLSEADRGHGATGRISDLIYPQPSFTNEDRQQADQALRATESAQPAIGAVSLGLFELLGQFGVRPAATAGHSFGEIPALFASGRIDARSALDLARVRGRLMAGDGGDRGSMLAVLAQVDQVNEVIRDGRLDVVIANKNAPKQVVLSGSTDEISRAAALFAEREIGTRRLPVAAAFHSRFVAEASGPLLEALRDVPLLASDLPVYSNTHAAPYPADPDQARSLLANQLAQPVDFVGLVNAMFDAGVRTFLEVGPGTTLTGLVDSILTGRGASGFSIDASRGQRGNVLDLAKTLARVAALGYPVCLTRWDEGAETRSAVTRKPGMTVRISGANITPKPRPASPPRAENSASTPKATPSDPPRSVRNDRPADPKHLPRSSEKAHKTSMNQHNGSPTHSEHRATSAAPISPSANGHHAHSALPSGDSTLLAQALREAQDNMLALQKLGEQTAQLHRQFLDGQDKAQRTFQVLLEQQHRIVNVSLGLEQPAPVQSLPPRFETAPSRPLPPEPAPRFTPPAAIETPPPSPRVQPAPAPQVAEIARAPVAHVALLHAQRILMEVVAEKTGYPSEMLEPGMELDADLGIDSIKRVEILSAIQERLPDAPAVKPEHLGTLRTLGQIAEFLAGSDAVGAEAPISVNGAAHHDLAVLEILRSIVAEKTGYPPEMLEQGMELDADLGIDSIKRVEILSALQERLPEAPVVKPEHLGTLRTLGQIAEFLGSGVSVGPTNGCELPPESSVGHIHDTLVSIVAEKTGYPPEMLEPGMELDADLGIDSIKRVEILSALQERLPNAPTVKPEHLGTLRTLGSIVEFLAEPQGSGVPSSNGRNGVSSSPAEFTHTNGADKDIEARASTVADRAAPSESTPVQSFELREVPLAIAANGDLFSLRAGAEIWVFGNESAFCSSLVGRLGSLGYRAIEIRPERLKTLSAPEQLGGLVILATGTGGDSSTIKDAFRLLRTSAAGLRCAGRDGGAVFVTVTRLDGAFGTRAYPATVEPTSGALAGLSKTASHEWPEVACKAIDLDPSIAGHDRSAQAIVDEMFRRGPREVGRAEGRRSTLELVPATKAKTGSASPVAKGEVVVISGGARGVTAEVAVALADAFQPVIVLLGRSPEPVAEPAWLEPLHVEADVKRALMTRANGHATPKSIAEEFDRVSSNREILRNIERIERTGASVIYRSVDIRDQEAVTAILGEIRSQHGPIRGLIHGAGVLADRKIEDQSDEQFARVFDTKVSGLRSLMGALGTDDLRFLGLFSSSTARFGRSGQVAYAAANEVLNKWAQREAQARPSCRVIAVNWGPWDGGMVTPSLKPIFEAEGVGLIPLREGARFLVDELRRTGQRPVEVVVLGAGSAVSAPAAESKPQPEQTAGLALVFERPVDVASMPVLRSHVLDARPVLPMALMLEWLAHGALHRNPGLSFCGLNDLRLLKGIIVRDDHPEVVRVLAGKAIRQDSLYIVPVELRGTLPGGRDVPHARAEVVLADRPLQGFQSLPTMDLPACSMSASEIYQRFLFHGPALQGIERVEGIGESGITVFAATAPQPSSWFDRPLRQGWLADPLAIDCAFQAMIVWTSEQLGSGSLPTCIGRYRQFRRTFPTGGVRIVAKITQANANRALADIEFLDTDGSCIALMEDYDCVIDASLNQAFRRNQLVEATQG